MMSRTAWFMVVVAVVIPALLLADDFYMDAQAPKANTEEEATVTDMLSPSARKTEKPAKQDKPLSPQDSDSAVQASPRPEAAPTSSYRSQ